jgi:hypothetical protein
LSYICVCGNESVIKLNHLLNGRLCKSCGYEKASKTKTKTYEEVKQMFELKGFRLLSKSYNDSRQDLTYLCKCGRISQTALSNLSSIQGCRDCWIDFLKSEMNPNRSLTKEQRHLQRKSPEYFSWRISVFQRDSYTCVKCGQYGGNLQAHHLDAFHWCEDRRYDTTNGATLCKSCHADFHHSYGKRLNTKAQFYEWMRKGNEKVV